MAASGKDLHCSSQFILFMLFTSCLYLSKVPRAGDSFLFLPRRIWIWASRRDPPESGPVTQPGVSMGSTGDQAVSPAWPCRTCGDFWWPGHVWPGITISGTAAGGPVVGAGPPAASSLCTRHATRPGPGSATDPSRLQPLNTSRSHRRRWPVSQYQPSTSAS